MARGPRLDAPGSLHHVIIRGIERKEIFRDDQDREDFLTRLGEIVQQGEADCLAWALIPNHAHLLLRTGKTSLSRMMRRLLTGYAVRFNLRHQRCGHLFQNRYKSIVCEEDSYLLELVRYIHLNALRAGLVKDLRELDRYPWGGHSVLMGHGQRGWQATTEVLAQFGGRKRHAQDRYRQFVEEGIVLGRREELGRGGSTRKKDRMIEEAGEATDPRVLGSGRFVQRVLEDEERALLRQARLKSKERNLRALLSIVGKEFGAAEEELKGGGRRRIIAIARSVFCRMANRELGTTGRQLSEMLQITPAAVFYSIERGERILAEDTLLQKNLEHYLNKLTTSP